MPATHPGVRWSLALLLGGLLIGATAASATAAIGSRTFTAHYDNAGADDEAAAVAIAPNGTAVYVTGDTYPASGDVNFTTVAYDAATRHQIWAQQYDGPGARDYALDAVATQDAVIVTGLSQMSGDLRWSVETIAYGASGGSILWKDRFQGPAASSTTSAALALSPDGSTVFVTGSTLGKTDAADFRTVAYRAADGSTKWISRFNDTATDVPTAITVDPTSQTVFVTGRGARRFDTIAYDAATGDRRWVNYYRAITDVHLPEAISAGPDGTRVFVTGRAQNEHGRYDIVTFALRVANGQRVWSNRFNALKGDDYPADLAVSPDGQRVAVTGQSQNSSVTTVLWTTIVFGAGDGQIRWSHLVAGSNQRATGSALSFGGNGQLIVSGSRAPGAAHTFSYDPADGAKLWGHSVDNAGFNDIAVNSDVTRVYLTGQLYVPGPGTDIITVGYSLTP